MKKERLNPLKYPEIYALGQLSAQKLIIPQIFYFVIFSSTNFLVNLCSFYFQLPAFSCSWGRTGPWRSTRARREKTSSKLSSKEVRGSNTINNCPLLTKKTSNKIKNHFKHSYSNKSFICTFFCKYQLTISIFSQIIATFGITAKSKQNQIILPLRFDFSQATYQSSKIIL